MTKLFKLLTSRLLLTIFIILVQLLVVLTILITLNNSFTNIYLFFQVISGLILIKIFNGYQSPSIKLPWIIFIIIMPITGILFYYMIVDNKMKTQYKKHIKALNSSFGKHQLQNQKILDDLKTHDPLLASKADYVFKNTAYPVLSNTTYQYFSIGEAMYEQMLIDLANAKHFIFMEYFIIKSGKMWQGICDILIKQAHAGLDVRLIYDDIGCLGMIPYDTYKVLEAQGVKVERFNPFKPILSIKHNTRDHRKICVIDGYIGYTGGLNLADEYINEEIHFGHWKDTAIRLYGEGCLQLTTLFLENWLYFRKDMTNIDDFLPNKYHKEQFKSDGYVQMFGDGPLNEQLIGQSVYMNIINQAKDYVYIYTPYFIVDNELIFALCLAAKRGVDIRIVLPHIPDKWYVHTETQSYYPRLIESGIKILEYTPGFMHAKSFISDDTIAIVGTANLDYRSLYHHFECGAIMYQASVIKDIKKDFIETMEKSQVFTIEDYNNISIIQRAIGALIKFFSPLM